MMPYTVEHLCCSAECFLFIEDIKKGFMTSFALILPIFYIKEICKKG